MELWNPDKNANSTHWHLALRLKDISATDSKSSTGPAPVFISGHPALQQATSLTGRERPHNKYAIYSGVWHLNSALQWFSCATSLLTFGQSCFLWGFVEFRLNGFLLLGFVLSCFVECLHMRMFKDAYVMSVFGLYNAKPCISHFSV